MGASLSHPRVNLSGRTAVVTGANTGIGYETAKALASMGAHVVVACRSEEKGTAAIQRMRDELPGQQLGLEFAKLNLSSLAQVKEFAAEFRRRHDSLHLLILNAGVSFPVESMTDDGFSIEYQVNHLSQFLLLLLLMPVMQKSLQALREQSSSSGNLEAASSSPASSATAVAREADVPPAEPSKEVRVIFVSSKGHDFGHFKLADLIAGQGKKFALYCESKLLQVMIAQYLQRHFNQPGLAFHSVHPGMVKTEISRDFQGFWKHFTKASGAVGQLRTPEQGAQTSLNAAVNPLLDGYPSTHFDSCKPTRTSAVSRNEECQEELWNVSLGHVQSYLDKSADLGIDWEEVEAAKRPEFMPAPASSADSAAIAKDTSQEAPEQRQQQAEENLIAFEDGEVHAGGAAEVDRKPPAPVEDDCLIIPDVFSDQSDGLPMAPGAFMLTVD